MREAPPEKPSDKWQKLYYRGMCPAGQPGPADHRSKIRLRDFEGLPYRPPAAARPRALPPPAEIPAEAEAQLIRRDWLIGVQEKLRALSPRLAVIPRLDHVDADHFLDHHYAANRPALLSGEIDAWPALSLWSPEYLSARLGDVPVEVQGGRTADARFERDKDAHRQTLPFAQFIDRIERPGAGNNSYLTAYNSVANKAALAPLHAELGRIDALLSQGRDADEAMLWIGPAHTFTPLHHDLTNNLFAQIVGRKRILLLSPRREPITKKPRACLQRDRRPA